MNAHFYVQIHVHKQERRFRQPCKVGEQLFALHSETKTTYSTIGQLVSANCNQKLSGLSIKLLETKREI